MASNHFYILGVPCSIPIEEMGERAIVERVPPSGPEADVLIKCPYNQRFNVVKGLLGGAIATGRTVSYLSPLAYPPSPNLRCTTIGEIRGLRPWVDSYGWVNYDWAIIPAHFELLKWDLPTSQGIEPDPSGIPYTTTTFQTSAEIFQPPTGSYYYTAGSYSGKPVAESSIGTVRPRVEITMTRRLMPFVPLSFSLSMVGKVNSATVRFADRIFPIGCLLYTGSSIPEPVTDPASAERRWDVSFNFMGNYSVEWNAFMDPAGAYRLINTSPAGSGDYPFAYADFSPFYSNTF